MSLLIPDECVCVQGTFEATVFLLLACLLSSLLFLNAINRLVEVKHCGGRREGTHTLTQLQESKAHSFPHFPSSARLHPSMCHVSPGGPEPTHRCALCQRWSTFAPSLLNLQTKASTRTFTAGTLRGRYGPTEQLWAHRCLCSHSSQPPQRDPAGGSPRHYLSERTARVKSRPKARRTSCINKRLRIFKCYQDQPRSRVYSQSV